MFFIILNSVHLLLASSIIVFGFIILLYVGVLMHLPGRHVHYNISIIKFTCVSTVKFCFSFSHKVCWFLFVH